MKILNCLECEGELDVIGEDGHCKIVKCRDCGFQSAPVLAIKKEPEIVIIKKIKRD